MSSEERDFGDAIRLDAVAVIIANAYIGKALGRECEVS